MCKGDHGDKMYILVQGKLGIYLQDNFREIRNAQPTAVIKEY